MDIEMTDFEKWLRTVCFQKPTLKAYDLAKMAWESGRDHGFETGVQNGIDAALDRSEFIRSSSPSELRH